MTDLVKTLRTPLALLALVLLAAFVGSSCSSVDPVALQVGQWQLSSKDFEDQLDQFAEVYVAAGQAEEAQLQGPTKGSWSTAFTAFVLNQYSSFQLVEQAVSARGLEVTQDDLDATESSLQEGFTGTDGTSRWEELPDQYRQEAVRGFAAQQVLAVALEDEDLTDDELRAIYDANVEQFGGRSFDEVKDGLVEIIEENPDLKFQAVMIVLGQTTDIYVDGRFGQFDAMTAQVVQPAGATQPSTTLPLFEGSTDSAPSAG